MGWQRVGHDWATELNWTEDVDIGSLLFSVYFIVPLLLSFFPFALFLCDLMTFHRVFFDSFSLYHLCIYCRFFLCDYWARCCSVTQSCPTLCGPMDCSMPGFPVLHHLPEFAQTHVCWVGRCHPTISFSVIPFSSCPQSFPASGAFPMSQFFISGGQSIGVSASASVLPMNIQDWFPLRWAGWVSLQSKGLSRVFSNTAVQKHQFFGTQLSLQSNSHTHTRLLEKP